MGHLHLKSFTAAANAKQGSVRQIAELAFRIHAGSAFCQIVRCFRLARAGDLRPALTSTIKAWLPASRVITGVCVSLMNTKLPSAARIRARSA